MLVLKNQNFHTVEVRREILLKKIAKILRECQLKNNNHIVITYEDIKAKIPYTLLLKLEKNKTIKFNRAGYTKKISNIYYSQVEIFINPDFLNWHIYKI